AATRRGGSQFFREPMMFAMIRRRVVESVFSLFCLICAVFFVARLTGDPGSLYLPLNATDEQVAEFNHLHGFDQPILTQFFDFVAGLARLDFGESLRRQDSALAIVLEAYPTTLRLAAATILAGLVIG